MIHARFALNSIRRYCSFCSLLPLADSLACQTGDSIAWSSLEIMVRLLLLLLFAVQLHLPKATGQLSHRHICGGPIYKRRGILCQHRVPKACFDSFEPAGFDALCTLPCELKQDLVALDKMLKAVQAIQKATEIRCCWSPLRAWIGIVRRWRGSSLTSSTKSLTSFGPSEFARRSVQWSTSLEKDWQSG